MDFRVTASGADLEQIVSDVTNAADEVPRSTSPVRVTFYHSRKRLADLDNLSGKAILDGIVRAGILATDTPEQVAEIRTNQVKTKDEKTVVLVERLRG